MTSELQHERLGEMICAVYDCAIEPARWGATLNMIRGALGFCNASLAINALPSGEYLSQIDVGIESPWREMMPAYTEDLMQLWGGPARLADFPLYEPLITSVVADPVEFARNRYILEWGAPQGINDAVAIGFMRDEGKLGTVGFGRLSQSGPVSELEMSSLRAIAPHLRRSATINLLFESKAAQTATFEATFEALRSPVLLLDASMRVVHANVAARSLLKEQTVLSVGRDRLRVLDANADRRLVDAIAVTAADEAKLDTRGVALPVRTVEGLPVVLHLLPLMRGPVRAGLQQRAVAALFVAQTGQAPIAPMDAIAELFDLTPAETRVTLLIWQGLSLKEIAGRIGVAASTAKTHLDRVLAKTGQRRQSDLIRLIQSLQLST